MVQVLIFLIFRGMIWLLASLLGLVVRYWLYCGGRVLRALTPTSAPPRESPWFKRANRFRSVVAPLAVVIANVQWNWGRQELGNNVLGILTSALAVPLYAALLVIPTALAFSIAALPGQRMLMLERMLIPIGTALLSAVALVIATWGPSWALMAHLALYDHFSEGMKILATSLLAGLLVAAMFAWSLLFTFGAFGASRHLFRARDGHPALPAVIGILVALWGLGLSIAALASGPDGAIPFWISTLFVLVGTTISLALGVGEIAWMVRVSGVRMRAVES